MWKVLLFNILMKNTPHNNEMEQKNQDKLVIKNLEKLPAKLQEKLRVFVVKSGEKIREILANVLANPAESVVALAKLPIKYKILMLLALGYFINKDGKSQTNPDYPEGYNFVKTTICFNPAKFSESAILPVYADQIRYTEKALDGSYQNRCLTIAGIMHPFDDTGISVPGNLSTTFTNFGNFYLNPNNMPNDVTYTYQSDCDAGDLRATSTIGEAGGENHCYLVFAKNSIDATLPSYIEHLWGHEFSHNAGENNGEHTKGKDPVNHQFCYPNVGWLDQTNGKTLGAAGAGTNTWLGAFTTNITDAVTDADGWVDIVDPHNQGFPYRIQASELVNTSGAGNTNDGIFDFFQNHPYRIFNQPLNANEIPVAPQLNLNGNLLSISNSEAYNAQFEIFAGSGEMIDGDYRWYLYHADNTADGAYIGSGKNGFGLDETVNLAELGLAGEALAVRVLYIDGNTLSEETELPTADTQNPNAVCQSTTVYLDENGQATISPEQVDGGSSDNVGIVNYVTSPNTVDCDDLGTVNVTLIVTDAAGNSDQCTTAVTVIDNIAPIVAANNSTEISLDENGVASVAPQDIDAGSSDNCGIADMSLSQTDFTEAGIYSVVFTVTDNSGNASTATVQITVIDSNSGDTNPPIAIAQDTEAELDENGIFIPTEETSDNGSYDPEGGSVSFAFVPSVLDCDNIGETEVKMIVSDLAGNTAEDMFIVYLSDVTAPAMSGQAVTIDLAVTNEVFPENVNAGSSDNCEIVSMTLVPNTFDNEGVYSATLSGVDASGNEGTTNVEITVVNSIGGISANNENSEAVKLYPNPTKGLVKVESAKSIQEIQIFNLSGQKMAIFQAPNNSYQAFKHSHEFNTTGWTPGVYLVKILTANGECISEKLVVE